MVEVEVEMDLDTMESDSSNRSDGDLSVTVQSDHPGRRDRVGVGTGLVVLVVSVALVGALIVRERRHDQRRAEGTGSVNVEITDVQPIGAFPVTAAALPDAGLESREGAAAVWTGREYLVWGGWRGGSPAADGAAYDPVSDTWSPIPEAPIQGRQSHVAAWTGAEMVVWGGSVLPPGAGQGGLFDGAIYDPTTGAWRPIAAAPGLTPSARPSRALWVAGRLVVTLSSQDSRPAPLGVYDPATESWRRSTPDWPTPPRSATWSSAFATTASGPRA
jgi:hypothetical protein